MREGDGVDEAQGCQTIERDLFIIKSDPLDSNLDGRSRGEFS
jgi:hypothetical protein